MATKRCQELTVQTVIETGLELVLSELKPERILVLYQPRGKDDCEIAGRYGFAPNLSLDSLDVPQGVVQSVLRTGKHLFLIDGLETGEFSTSLILCGVRSVLCAPILHPSGLRIGVLYVDDRRAIGRFGETESQWLHETGSNLGQQLSQCPRREKSQPDRWTELRARGLKARRSGQLDLAEAELRQAVQWCRDQRRPKIDLARSLNELAEVVGASGKCQEAEKHLLECLNVVEESGLTSRPETAPFLNNLAGLVYRRGEHAQSAELYLRALSVLDSSNRAHDPWAVPVLCNLGTLYFEQGRLEHSEAFLNRARLMAEGLWGKSDLRTKRCQDKVDKLKGGVFPRGQ